MNRLTLNRVRIHRRGGTFPGRSQSEVHRLRDAVAIHRVREFDPNVNAIRVRAVFIDFDSGIVSGSKLGEGGNGCDPLGYGNKGLEVVWSHGDRFDAPKVWSPPVGEKRLVGSSQSVVLERVEQVPDDRVALIRTCNPRGCRAVTAVGNRGVLVGVKQPHGVIVGEVLKRREAAP